MIDEEYEWRGEKGVTEPVFAADRMETLSDSKWGCRELPCRSQLQVLGQDPFINSPPQPSPPTRC